MCDAFGGICKVMPLVGYGLIYILYMYIYTYICIYMYIYIYIL